MRSDSRRTARRSRRSSTPSAPIDPSSRKSRNTTTERSTARFDRSGRTPHFARNWRRRSDDARGRWSRRARDKREGGEPSRRRHQTRARGGGARGGGGGESWRGGRRARAAADARAAAAVEAAAASEAARVDMRRAAEAEASWGRTTRNAERLLAAELGPVPKNFPRADAARQRTSEGCPRSRDRSRRTETDPGRRGRRRRRRDADAPDVTESTDDGREKKRAAGPRGSDVGRRAGRSLLERRSPSRCVLFRLWCNILPGPPLENKI